MRALPRPRPATGAASRSRCLRRRATAVAALKLNRTDTLRQLLKGPDILKGPCCHDALSARLIERAGFDFAFMSGFCTAGARLGAPDTGLISYYEMVDQGRYIHEATRRIPVIGDGDTGYGNAVNVKRTVRGYAAAGFAGILIEDQVAPKSCGHVRGKRVAPRDEAVARIRAAADARDEGADILVLARSDARQAESLQEALWRAAAFADAGADLLFVDALGSEEEMRAFCRLGGAAAGLPKMANMLEGGGKTPILPPEELQALGFKLVAYPLSLLGASIRAMERALAGLKAGRVPDARDMGTFVDIQVAVGFPEYYEEEARYAVAAPSSGGGSGGSGGSTGGSGAAAPSPPAAQAAAAPFVSGFGPGAAAAAPAAPPPAAEQQQQKQQPAAAAVVEADEVVPPGGAAPASALAPALQPGGGAGGSGAESRWQQLRRSKFFRVVIRDQRTGIIKLETRIPAGFLSGLTALVPQVAGVDLERAAEAAMGGELDLDTPLVDYASGNDAVQVFLE